jgi:tetratricopeptide (TPR) repeat protein
MKRPLPSAVACTTALLLVLLLALPAAAQNIQNLPRPSPAASVAQRVGVSDVEIRYHRPAINNREVWGALVPYGAVWRAGANDNTTITLSDPAKVEGKDLAAGTYGLHMIPAEDEWTVIFSNDSTSWGSFTYDQAEDALRVTVRPEKAPYAEQLAYAFEDVSNTGAVAVLHWEELKVPFEITFDTHALAIAEIRRQLRHLPQFAWQGWLSAAGYLVANDIEHEQALEWVERSVSMNRNGQNLGLKFRLLQQLDRGEEAEAVLAEALAASDEAQTNQLGYTLLFAGDADTATEIFQKNVDDYPESWNVYDSLGEAYATKGDPARARELYQKALSMAPEAQHARIEGVLQGLPAE